MKEKFKDHRFIAKTKVDLDRILEISDKYAKDGIKPTIRQIFYRLVSLGYIDNTKASYNRIGGIVDNARYAGLFDWDKIRDGTRETHTPSSWKNPTALMQAALKQYRLPRTETQENYIEVITEKDALHSVLSPIAERYHLPFSVFRGYSSTTAIYELSKRILQNAKPAVLLYIGDHDPSGLDMLRDIRERVKIFTHNAAFKLIPVALTIKQIEDEHPPANFANGDDVRADEYIKTHGDKSWEADALDPKMLRDVLTSTIQKYLDISRMNAIIEREKRDKAYLKEIIAEVNRK